jgi:hypothetical protein
MKSPDRRLDLVLGILLLAAGPQATDHARVLSVSPGGPLTRGVPVVLTITIEADLESGRSGMVQIGFNDEEVNRFRMIQGRQLHPGRDTVVFTCRVVPVDWGTQGQFTVEAYVGGPLTRPSWTPTTATKAIIAVKP